MGGQAEHPKAGMFVWARLPGPIRAMGSMAFALRLMETANVAVAPGIGFGEEGEGYLRLALVENEHHLRQAIRQMRRALPGIIDAGKAQPAATTAALVVSPRFRWGPPVSIANMIGGRTAKRLGSPARFLSEARKRFC